MIDEAGATIPVSEDCAWVLGRALQLDWVDFDAAPAAFDTPTTTVELVLAGALVLFAPDAPPVSTRDVYGLPSELSLELDDQIDENDLDDETSQGALWYGLITDWSDDTSYDGEEDEAIAYYSSGDVAMSELGDDDYGPVEVAGILWHEASHGFLHRHFYDPDNAWLRGYDEDIEGANGSQAWWLYNWLRAHEAALDAEPVGDIEWAIWERCFMILGSEEKETFEPCAAT